MGKRGRDITGEKIGRLTVISQKGRAPTGQLLWVCVCDCGKHVSCRGDHLRGRRKLHCGCVPRTFIRDGVDLRDLVGSRFSKLQVLKKGECNTLRQMTWLCRCDCGKEVTVSTGSLRSGHTKSCGCLLKELLTTRAQAKYLSSKGKTGGFNLLLRRYKNNAASRGVSWELSEERFAWMTRQECIYCGSEPDYVSESKVDGHKYTYNGIDRIDNSLGYTEDNAVPCCGVCNRMKTNRSLPEFLKKIMQIHNRIQAVAILMARACLISPSPAVTSKSSET